MSCRCWFRVSGAREHRRLADGMVLARGLSHRRTAAGRRARARRRGDVVRGVRGRDAVGLADAVRAGARELSAARIRRNPRSYRDPVEIDRMCCVVFTLLVPLGFLALVVLDVFFYMAALVLEMIALAEVAPAAPPARGTVRGRRRKIGPRPDRDVAADHMDRDFRPGDLARRGAHRLSDRDRIGGTVVARLCVRAAPMGRSQGVNQRGVRWYRSIKIRLRDRIEIERCVQLREFILQKVGIVLALGPSHQKIRRAAGMRIASRAFSPRRHRACGAREQNRRDRIQSIPRLFSHIASPDDNR